MKKKRILRKIDPIGRITIPQKLRLKYQMDCGEVVEIYTKQDGIYLRKYDMERNVKEQEQETARKIEESLKRVNSKLDLL